MTINLKDLTPAEIKVDLDEKILVIAKIKENGHVPSYITVRSMITENMFTSEVTRQVLMDLQKDENIQSINESRKYRLF